MASVENGMLKAVIQPALNDVPIPKQMSITEKISQMLLFFLGAPVSIDSKL